MCLIISLLFQIRILRPVEIVGDLRRCQHPAADHIEGRMHAGDDTIVAHDRGPRKHFLVTLRHEIGHRNRVAPGFCRMAARETAIFGRLLAFGRLQRRQHHDIVAPAIGASIFEITFSGLRRSFFACHVDEIDSQAEIGIGRSLGLLVRLASQAAIVAIVIMLDRGRVCGDIGNRRRLPGALSPGFGQGTEAIDNAGVLAAAIIEIRGKCLFGGAAARDFHHIIDIGPVQRLIDNRTVGGAVRNAIPVRLANCRAIILRRRFHPCIDKSRTRCPDFEKTG
ncbi:hypothetical protein D3C73_820090 [compost metagenome]